MSQVPLLFETLIAAAIGGALWLDKFQAFQIMVSRPIVSATLTGWVLGNIQAGIASGILFELLWLREPPVGGYIPPDCTLASISTAAVSAIVIAETGAPVASVVFVAFLLQFPVAFVGTRIDDLLRGGLGRLAHQAEKKQPEAGERWLWYYIFLALLISFFTVFLILIPIILVSTLFLLELLPRLSTSFIRASGLSFYAIPLIGIADLMAGISEKRYIILFMVGFTISMCSGLFFRL